MKTLEESPPISGRNASPIATGVADAGVIRPAAEVEAHHAAWQRLIDYQLVEWGRNPGLLADDGLPAPSPAVLRRACSVAKALHDAGWPPPQRVCTDGEGGIVFERSVGAVFQALHVEADGTVELVTFVDSRIRSRTRVF